MRHFFSKRVSQHCDIKKQIHFTALSCHSLSLGHNFDYDSVSILEQKDEGRNTAYCGKQRRGQF